MAVGHNKKAAPRRGECGWETSVSCWSASLRWYYPGQVPRILRRILRVIRSLGFSASWRP